MVFSSFNNVFRKATPGQRNEQGRAHDIGFPTLINHSVPSLENEDTLPVARHKHHRPLPLNLDAQKVIMSSLGTSGFHLSESVSSGGTHFELMSTPSSTYPNLTLPISDLPSRASPSLSQPEPGGEAIKNRMTRRRGNPSAASRPSLHHRASSLDSPLPSPTTPHTGNCFPYRKGSSTSSALSYSESNASKTIFSPTDPCPSTAYTTPLSSASGSHFHSRRRLFSLENPVHGLSRSTQAVPHPPISPKTLLEHRALTPPSPPNPSAASLFGINNAPWNLSFSTAPPSRVHEQIVPDSAGLVLEISQSAVSGSETLLEPVLHKLTGRDLNGKEWIKWEVRLCLPPRRFGSSPAVGFSSPNRTRRSSRTTPKLSGIGELSTAALAATAEDLGPPLSLPKKKSLGPRRRGLSLLTSPVHPDPHPASHIPSSASPTRKPVPFSVLVTQASPSSSSPAQVISRRGGSVFTKPVGPPAVAVAPSQSLPYMGRPSSDFPVEETLKGPEESILKNSPQNVALKLSPSTLVARKLAHDKLLGYPTRRPSVESTISDLGRLSVHPQAPEVSYWSETDASQTEVDDEDEKEEEDKAQVSSGQIAPVANPDPQEPTGI